jgi:hypothetical protein
MVRLFLSASLLPFALSFIGCASSDTRDGAAAPPAPPAPALAFGEDTDKPSATAPELFAKLPANPNPKTLAGVYERTGYGSENRESEYLVIQNNWRARLEIRGDKVVAGMECNFDVGGASTAKNTIYAYASSPVTVESWGIRIEKAQSDKTTWDDYKLDCSVDLPDATWPYCTGNRSVPDGYSSCIYLDPSLQLQTHKIDGTDEVVGVKVRN